MIKLLAGAVLSGLFPSKALQVEQGFTIPYFTDSSNQGIVNRLIRGYVGYKSSRDPSKLESLHKKFWNRQQPDGWFEATASRLHTVYVPTFRSLCEEIHTELRTNGIESVVEFGTGNGDWLSWLHTNWTVPKSYLGVDLAEEQVAANRVRHPDLQFVPSDLTKWVAENSTRNTLFITNCGVLEYLSESTLRRLFESIRSQHKNSMVLFVEPIARDYDLGTETRSRILGSEFSLSHNYPHLLSQAGFKVFKTQEHEVEGFRMLSTLAKSVCPGS